MQKLIDGYLRFREEVFPKWKEHFHLLAESQSPSVLFITCSDSRVVPDMIFQTEPGDMFLCRNAGNVVPPVGQGTGGVSATIEYAVDVLKVSHIIICGHSDCGAVRASMRPELTRDLPLVRPWLHFVEEAQAMASDALCESGDDADTEVRKLTHANVVGQLANLSTHPAVARALVAGTVTIHGWCYDILTGGVEVYCRDEGRFIALEDCPPGSAL